MQLTVVNVAGQQCSLPVQQILSIDGVPFGAIVPIDLQNLHDRLVIQERALGELLLQLQPLSEFSSVESPSPLEGQSQPDLQPLTQEEQQEG